jgi:type I restriction enzyme S subunit
MKETRFKQTEIGLIPEDWKIISLEEIGEPKMCKRILKNQTFIKGDIPFYKIGTFGGKADAYISKSLYEYYKKKFSFPQKGNVLISAAGTIGRLVIYQGEDAYYQDSNIVWIDNKEEKLLNQYLYYTLKNTSWDTSQGTIQRLYNASLKAKQIIIPLSINEQKKIASALTSIDNLLLSLDKLIEKKRLIKQGAMQELLTGKKRLPWFTEEWVERRLGEISKIYRGGSPRPIENYLTTMNDGINWIKIGDVDKSAKYIYKTQERIKPSGVSSSRYVKSGDFLLSNSMSFGRPYILKTSGCIHDGWLVIQDYQQYCDCDFLYYTLSSNYILQQYKAKAAGSSVLNLNKDIASNVIMKYPKDILEQKAIAKVLSSIDKEIESLEGKKAKYEQIKQGMMQLLLTGKIRLIS